MSAFGNSGFGKKVAESAKEVPAVVEKPKEEKPKAPQTKAEKIKALEALTKVMDKAFGTTGTMMRLGEQSGLPVPSIATGMLSVDYGLLSCGGVPKGRIIEVYGPESSGKTTWALDTIAQAQKAGGLAAFVDAEHALDPQYAAKLGVDVENLFVSQPDYGEQALEIVDYLIESRAVDIIVVDSVAALVPKAELDGDMGDANVGLHARLMSQAMRKLTAKCHKAGIILIFINQVREKVGVMFGSPEVTTGGKALKFYASVRIDIRKTKYIGADGTPKEFQGGDKSDPIGHIMKLKAVKCKVGPPFRETEIYHFYETGFDRIGDMVSFADKLGIFKKRGSWVDLPQEGKEPLNLGNSMAAAKATVKDSLDIQAQIRALVWDKLNPPKEEKEEAA